MFSVDALILRHDCRSLFAVIFRMTFPTGGLILCPWCFLCLFSFAMQLLSEVPRPIAVKLRHMIGKLHHLGKLTLIESKNSGAIPPKNWGRKHGKISDDFLPLHTLIANITGTGQYIENRKYTRSRAIPPAFDKKGPANFGPPSTENSMWIWTH